MPFLGILLGLAMVAVMAGICVAWRALDALEGR